MKYLVSTFLLAASLLVHAQDAPVAPAKPPVDPHAGHGAGASSGLKKELIEHVTEKDFLRLSETPKTVMVTIVAVWSDDNYGMNFNGYSKGNAVYTIPKDWKVEVTYINPSPVPHSLIVIDKDDIKKLQVPEPVFAGAAVPKHRQGMSYAVSKFAFTASEVGEYAFACGFPTHALNGHWIALNVSADAQVPTLKLGDKAVVEATK